MLTAILVIIAFVLLYLIIAYGTEMNGLMWLISRITKDKKE